MNIDSLIRDILKRGDYSHKQRVYDSLDSDAAFQRFAARVGLESKADDVPVAVVNNSVWKKYAAIAAAVLVPVCIATAVFMNHEEDKDLLAQGVAPGTEQAFIVTSNGDTISLGMDSKNIDVDDVKAVASNGELDMTNSENVAMATICVPRGGEYKVRLSDGTMVHLNSDSKLIFPTQFTGDSRDVKLEGEAYFEVSHSDSDPFIVHLGDVSVKQYGTHFNISSYAGKNKVITLVEGSIGVAVGKSSECRLTPGRQAVINGADIQVCAADVDAAVGWTEGMFRFDGETLGEISSTLSRWYDVDICVDASVRNTSFTGCLSRQDSLSDILNAICEITNTKVTSGDGTIKIKP